MYRKVLRESTNYYLVWHKFGFPVSTNYAKYGIEPVLLLAQYVIGGILIANQNWKITMSR